MALYVERFRETGLVSYPSIGLAKARLKAGELPQVVADGRDPIAEKAREKEPIFAVCVELFVESMEGQWRNEKHRAQWRMTLTAYCGAIQKKPVSEIGPDDILKVLKPIWTTKTETASRLQGRIERNMERNRSGCQDMDDTEGAALPIQLARRRDGMTDRINARQPHQMQQSHVLSKRGRNNECY